MMPPILQLAAEWLMSRVIFSGPLSNTGRSFSHRAGSFGSWEEDGEGRVGQYPCTLHEQSWCVCALIVQAWVLCTYYHNPMHSGSRRPWG